MDEQLLESLLYQEESETLDFKEGQYAFNKANHTQKAELLKDILAFANAWRQSDAYILIGVKEVRAGRSIVCGIDSSEHLLDRNLQQFVHGKTNRPVSFSYAPFCFEGVEIGILTIPLQERPVYLRADYGDLRANITYIRRGSSTGEAGPDEVLRMVATAGPSHGQPVLQVDFVDPENRRKLGASVPIECTAFEIPPADAIPEYGEPVPTILGRPVFPSHQLENRGYYSDVAGYLRDFGFLRPLGLAVTNSSSIVAEGVLVTMEMDGSAGLCVLDESDRPDFPSTQWTPPFGSPAGPSDKRIDVLRHGRLIEVRAEFEAIQPGVTAWSHNVFYIGARESMTAAAQITLSAHNLQVPVVVSADITIQVTASTVEVGDIVRLAELHRFKG